MIVGWQEVAIVLALLYLFECLHWLRQGQVAFVSEVARFRMHLPTDWHTRMGAPCWGPLLPPGCRVVSQAWPMAIAPQGIRSGVAFAYGSPYPDAQEARALGFDAIDSVGCDGRTVQVNGHEFARCRSPRQAHEFATRLQRLRTLEEDQRAEAIIAWLREGLDVVRVADQWRRVRAATLDLRITSTVLCLFLLVGVPWFVATRPLVTHWPSLLGAWLVLLAIHGAFYAMAHRAIFAGRIGDAIAPLVTQMLVPMTAVRAHVQLTQDALGDGDPIAISRCLGDHRSADALIRWVVHSPACTPGGAAATPPLQATIESWFQREFIDALKQAHAGDMARLEHALEPPAREGPHSLSFCPRCRAQYVVASGTCSCAGVTLVPYAEAAAIVARQIEILGQP